MEQSVWAESGAPLMIYVPEEIQKILEHYGPEFIWVDRVEIYEDSAVGYLNVTAERCRGHFNASRGFPLVLPEVFFAECAGQTGAVSLLARLPKIEGEEYLPVFAGEKKCNISAPALVGDVLVMRVSHLQRKPPRARAECFLNGREETIFWMEFGYRLLPRPLWERIMTRRV